MSSSSTSSPFSLGSSSSAPSFGFAPSLPPPFSFSSSSSASSLFGSVLFGTLSSSSTNTSKPPFAIPTPATPSSSPFGITTPSLFATASSTSPFVSSKSSNTTSFSTSTASTTSFSSSPGFSFTKPISTSAPQSTSAFSFPPATTPSATSSTSFGITTQPLFEFSNAASNITSTTTTITTATSPLFSTIATTTPPTVSTAADAAASSFTASAAASFSLSTKTAAPQSTAAAPVFGTFASTSAATTASNSSATTTQTLSLAVASSSGTTSSVSTTASAARLRSDSNDWVLGQPLNSTTPSTDSIIMETHLKGEREKHVVDADPTPPKSAHEDIHCQVCEESTAQSQDFQTEVQTEIFEGQREAVRQTERLDEETSGEKQGTVQQMERVGERTHMLSTEENLDHIIKEIVTEISDTLPFQETKALPGEGLGEGLPEMPSEETHTSLQLTNEGANPSTIVPPNEMTTVPHLSVQVSQGDLRVVIQPPDFNEISSTDSDVETFPLTLSPRTAASFASGYAKLVNQLLQPKQSLKEFTIHFLSMETQEMIHSLRDQQWIPYELRLGLDSLLSTWHVGRKEVGDTLDTGIPEELVCSPRQPAVIALNTKEECHQELKGARSAKRILEEQLFELNNKIRNLEAKLKDLVEEERVAARRERIRQISDRGRIYKFLSKGPLLELQEWFTSLTSSEDQM